MDRQLPPLSLSLQDWLSLGEVGTGLAESKQQQQQQQQQAAHLNLSLVQETQRLPMLLRLLGVARPLASVSILDTRSRPSSKRPREASTESKEEAETAKEEEEDDKDTQKETDQEEASAVSPNPAKKPKTSSTTTSHEPLLQQDRWVNETVEQLEHIAAIHSVAEGVDVITCHLTPSLTRPKLSKLAPLTKQKKDLLGSAACYDTSDLAAVAKDPKGPPTAHRRKATNSNEVQPHNHPSDDDEDSEEEEEDLPQADFSRRNSLEVAAEDSQEVTVLKTIQDLASLVVLSLEPIVSTTTTTAEDQGPEEKAGPEASHHPKNGQPLALATDDSILAESENDGETDLGSTVAAILHHAPVLQSRHVANALCRASVPQVGDLMIGIGANCPATTAPLLLGCIQAYQLAIAHQQTPIVQASKQAVLSLAGLSPREKSRVAGKLQQEEIMWDVQLELALQDNPGDNPVAAAFILKGQLSKAVEGCKSSSHQTHMMMMGSRSPPALVTQISGDGPRDFRSSSSKKEDALEPSLQRLLLEKPTLYSSALQYLGDALRAISEQPRISKGRLLLILKAYGWLVMTPCKPTMDLDRSRIIFDEILPVLRTLLDHTKGTEAPEATSLSGWARVLYSSVILSLARILQQGGNSSSSSSNSDQSNDRRKDCQAVLQVLEEWQQGPLYRGFREGIVASTNKNHPSVPCLHILNAFVEANLVDIDTDVTDKFRDIQNGLRQVCNLAGTLDASPSKTETAMEVDHSDAVDFVSTVTNILCKMEKTDSSDMASSILDTLQQILHNPEGNLHLPALLDHDLIPHFVSRATVSLCDAGFLDVPLVLNIQLEKQGTKLRIDWHNVCESSEEGAVFLLQLLHSFEYLDCKSESAFVFDPRSVPVKEALWLAESISRRSDTSSFLCQRLTDLTQTHCPDCLSQFQRARDLVARGGKPVVSPAPRKQIKALLYKRLRSCIEGGSHDMEIPSLECIFLEAKSNLCDADLATTVFSAFLASPHLPHPVFTYNILCRDPLVLFKCPVRIWKRRVLRRIALYMLSTILEANCEIVLDAAPTPCVANEFLASRDVLIVRCLLMMSCGVHPEIGPTSCAMMTSFIRAYVCDHPGLIASLIKQGLPGIALDWLVEHVPECIGDAQELQLLLSDRSSLTPAERLVAADAVVRIAVVHGERNDEEATKMAYAALSQIIDSFFLVVGPVGVPVNALMPDESGSDVTQIARKAAIRLLKSLQRITGRRGKLRKECCMTLQKIANLCKSESAHAGVAGAVAGRRKAFMRELLNLTVKAENAMGGSIALQSN